MRVRPLPEPPDRSPPWRAERKNRVRRAPTEHAGDQADREDQERRARQHAADAEVSSLLDAFQPQEAEQVQAGQREQDDPGGEESFAREDVPLQHLVDRAEVLQARTPG